MERIHGTCKVSNFEPEDIISRMPDNVVSYILDRLPLQEALRTCILARNWRFKWTLLSQLVFDENFFKYLLKTKHEANYENIISMLLLHLKGVVSKFVLYIKEHDYCILNDEDINNWTMFLSRNGIKDLTFCKADGPRGPRLNLPTHLFSCLELKHLKLDYCCLDPPASFNGFPNLLSLRLYNVQFERTKYCDFFARCPALEILKMSDIHFTSSASKVKLVEIEKLTNLKILTSFVGNLLKSMINTDGIFQLVGSLPKLEYLHLSFLGCKPFKEDNAREIPPIILPCLKTLKLSKMDVSSGIMLSFVYEIIKGSPNLQILEITGNIQDPNKPRPVCSEVDYNTTTMLQLRRVVFKNLEALERHVCLIKCLLACSPFLKKFVIQTPSLMPAEKLVFSTKLLKLHRASPVAEISLL